MSIQHRNQAINSVRQFQMRERKRFSYEFALLGNNSGVVEIPGESGIVYVRLHGDSNQVVRALASTTTPCGNDDWGTPVKVERVKSYAGAIYKIIGFADDILPGHPRSTLLSRHAHQHARLDYDAGGCDPLDIHPDAFLPLRAQPTSPPSWSVDVLPGIYQRPDGTYGIYAGGTSGTFVPVQGITRRCDLLYLASDGETLVIVQGVPTTNGDTPARPSVPGNCTPICYVYLDGTMTAIDSFRAIASARILVSSSLSQSFVQLPAGTAEGQFIRAGADPFAPEWSTLTLPNAATQGDLLVATATNAIGTIASVAAGRPLLSGGVDAVPAYSDGYLDLASGKTLKLSGDSVEIVSGGASAKLSLANAPFSLLGGGTSSSLTLPNAATTITGGGTLALGGNTLTINSGGTLALNNTTFAVTGGGTLALGGNTLTINSGGTLALNNTTFAVTGGGTLALGGFTLTVPATGTAVLTTRTITAGVGLTGGGDLSADRTIAMGTPSTLSVSSSNSASGTTHTHAVTTSSNPGTSAAILATDANGIITLNRVVLNAGTTTRAPLSLTSGSLLSTPTAGAVEYNGTRFFITNSSGRRRGIATEEYIQSRVNLVTNGSGLLGDNTNFSGFTFDPIETYGGGGSFSVNVASGLRLSDEFIPVDPTRSYLLSGWGKSGNANGTEYNPDNRQLFGVALYDIDGNIISVGHSSRYPGAADTTLAANLNVNDTVVHLTNVGGWYNGTTSHWRNFAWWPYYNQRGYEYPPYTYTRNQTYGWSVYDYYGAWAATGTNALGTATWASADKSLTRSSGSFLDDGVVAGMTVTSTSSSNPGPLTVATVTSTKLTFVESVIGATETGITLTYVGEGVNHSTNTIKLRRPWPGPALPAGTPIRNNHPGSTYQYIALSNAPIPNTWTFYQGSISPQENPEHNTGLLAGTSYIRVLFLVNYHGAADNRVRWSNITLREIPQYNDITLCAATGNQTAYVFRYTVNKATSGDDTGLLINQIDTASPGTSYLLRAQRNGVDRFLVTNDGIGTFSGAVTLGGLTNTQQLAVRASASQSSNLVEFRNSGGTVQLALAANGRDWVLDTTTGTRIGTATNQRLAFWNATPITQPTTSIAGATFVANSGTAINDASTFDGYTIAKVVRALRNLGLLA